MIRLTLLVALAASAATQTRNIEVDAGKVIGTIRSFQGTNAGPLPLAPQLPNATAQYKEMRIDIVRTHDFFGPTDIDAKWPKPDPIARAVKADGANSIFRDWEADPEREESYNFGPSDKVIQAIVNCGAAVYYRVGRSWSADPSPPADFDKFAGVVKHVAMHYNQGWAHGFRYGIRYWEFWNEPDLEASWFPGFAQPFWTGTPQQYYALYEKVARALKSLDPAMKVGGPGLAAGNLPSAYREGLLDYCAAHKVPLDFYSWHHYPKANPDPQDFARLAREYRKLLDAKGFPKAEIHVTEWNMTLQMTPQAQATMEAAAFAAAAQIYLQDSPMDRSFYYRGDAGQMGFLEANGSLRRKAYAYKMLGMMLDTPRRLSATGADTEGFAVLAGRAADGKSVQVMIANYRGADGYELKVGNLPWGKGEYTIKRYIIMSGESWAESEGAGKGGSVELSSKLAAPGVELVRIQPR